MWAQKTPASRSAAGLGVGGGRSAVQPDCVASRKFVAPDVDRRRFNRGPKVANSRIPVVIGKAERRRSQAIPIRILDHRVVVPVAIIALEHRPHEYITRARSVERAAELIVSRGDAAEPDSLAEVHALLMGRPALGINRKPQTTTAAHRDPIPWHPWHPSPLEPVADRHPSEPSRADGQPTPTPSVRADGEPTPKRTPAHLARHVGGSRHFGGHAPPRPPQARPPTPQYPPALWFRILELLSWYSYPMPTPPCPVVERIRSELLHRAKVGYAKYGVTMMRDDMDLRAWVQSAKEEALDLAVYLERILMMLETDGH